MLGYLLDRDLDREVKSIAAVENRTRYHGFRNTSVGIAEGDYASLSERMSGCAMSLAGLERISKVLNEFLGEISIHTQCCGFKDDPKLGNVNLKVDECVETLKRRLKMQNIQIDYLSRRVEVQLRAVSDASFVPQLPTRHPLVSPADPDSDTAIQPHSPKRSQSRYCSSRRLAHARPRQQRGFDGYENPRGCDGRFPPWNICRCILCHALVRVESD